MFKKKYCMVLILGVLMLISIASSDDMINGSSGQKAIYSINGKILDIITLEPIGGAGIELSGPVSAQTQADQDGDYTIDGLIPGSYILAISGPGYISQKLAFAISDDNRNLTFVLEKTIEPDTVAKEENYSENKVNSVNWIPIHTIDPSEPNVMAETTIENSSGSVIIDFDLSGFERIDTENGTAFKIVGQTLSLEPGAPIVPAVVKNFVLPPNAKIVGSEILELNTSTISFIKPLIYVPYAKTPQGLVPVDYEIKKFIGQYPGEYYRIGNISEMNDGNSISVITVWPVQYMEANESVTVLNSAKIKVSFSYDELTLPSTPAAVSQSLLKFGEEKQLKRGVRKANDSSKSDTSLSKYKAFSVKEDGRSEYSMISLSFWRTYDSENSKNLYGILTYNESATPISKAKAVQHLSDYGEVYAIENYDQVKDMIKDEWQSSPGIVLFGNDIKIGSSLCPLSSYLNWPLVSMQSDSDLEYLKTLISSTNAQNVIKGGALPVEIENWLNSEGKNGNLILTSLGSPDEINEFLYIQQLKSGFFDTVKDPDEALYDKAINKDFLSSYSKKSDTKVAKGPNYLVVTTWNNWDRYSSAATQLATYRSAWHTYSDENDATSLKEYINSVVDPVYIALMGDGDPGYVPCAYITDPYSHAAGLEPNLMPTDFYYEEREGSTVGIMPTSWAPDSYVGRVIGSSDLEAQEYVSTIKKYETGTFSETNWINWAILGSNDWGGSSPEATMEKVATWLNTNGGIISPVKSYATSSPNYNGHPFSREYYVESAYGLDNTIPGVTVGYVNTHGSPDAIYFPEASSIGLEANYLTYSELLSHETLWRRHPFLQYTDACLTACFAGTESFTQHTGTRQADPSYCIGCRFIDGQAIGFIGATMISYLGAIDGIDEKFFENRITNWDETQGMAHAFARMAWWDSQASPGALAQKTVWEMMLIGDPYVDIRMSSSEEPMSSSVPDHLGNYKGNGVWALDYNGNGAWDGTSTDRVFAFGGSTDQPVVGDWNNDGKDELGNYKGNGVWALDYNGNGAWDGTSTDRVFVFGGSTDKPVVGDWNNDGKDELGNYKGNGVWALDYNGNGAWDGTSIDRVFVFGGSTDLPVVGDWNSDGKDELGNYKGNGVWALDYNGNGAWDGTSTDRVFAFGGSTDKPVVGKW
jgi:hypothetical protein